MAFGVLQLGFQPQELQGYVLDLAHGQPPKHKHQSPEQSCNTVEVLDFAEPACNEIIQDQGGTKGQYDLKPIWCDACTALKEHTGGRS